MVSGKIDWAAHVIYIIFALAEGVFGAEHKMVHGWIREMFFNIHGLFNLLFDGKILTLNEKHRPLL